MKFYTLCIIHSGNHCAKDRHCENSAFEKMCSRWE